MLVCSSRICFLLFYIFLMLPYSRICAQHQYGTLAAQAMVVSAHPEASRVGVDILKKGGNAIDAAVAVQMALAVVYPQAGNIGGGGFLIYRSAKGEAFCLDFRETAPAAAHRDMYLDSNGNIIPQLSIDGHLAAGVPGTVDGCIAMHERFGTLPWADLIQPAVDLARNGFVLTEKEAGFINKEKALFERLNRFNYFQKIGEWAAGDTIHLEDLAGTLARIRDGGRAGFYAGQTAALLLAEMQYGGGIITQADLDNYHSVWRTPLRGSYKNMSLITMPPPSSGGICLLQILHMLKNQPLQQWGLHSTAAVHAMAEAERRAYADRATYMGDPDFVRVPQKSLLNIQYLQDRFASFNPEQATPSEHIQAGTLPAESEETTHISIIDTEGNAVSLTTTLNSRFGNKVFVQGAGFLLNNEMDDFSAKSNTPNQFGLIANSNANTIEPNKRMLSSMTPTIAEKDGKVYMVLGAPGGATIITSVLQTLLNVEEFGLSMQEAVALPRFHHQWKPDQIFLETDTFSEQQRAALEALGHRLKEREPIGRVEAILRRDDGILEGGADPRGDDSAQGF